ncbi:hypothetical protein RRG08_003012, partial [Elysia crispata]
SPPHPDLLSSPHTDLPTPPQPDLQSSPHPDLHSPPQPDLLSSPHTDLPTPPQPDLQSPPLFTHIHLHNLIHTHLHALYEGVDSLVLSLLLPPGGHGPRVAGLRSV